MFGLGIGEITIILVIALIFIGPKKLPELARGLGKGIKEFQNATRGIQSSVMDDQPHSVLAKEDDAKVTQNDSERKDKKVPTQPS